MGTQIKFTPLLGALSEGPLCFLLEVKDFTFLLDCGWNDRYNPAALQPVLDVLPRIDAVLLSHPDPAHLGALPYLVKHGLQAQVYATLPVHRMGQLFLYDQYNAQQATREFKTEVFSLDDVDRAFAKTRQLKYQQNLALSGKGMGFVITPYVAGHLVGGSIWRITTPDGEDIIYAVDFNHKKERHLNGTVLETAFNRPAVLIADALNALQLQPDNKPQREREFIDTIMATLRGNGNVLIPVDTAGRVLELSLQLEKHWSEHRLAYPLALVTHVSYSTIKFAMSQLEWMNDAIAKQFEHSRDNPFNCRHAAIPPFMKLCQSVDDLARLPAGPKVVLASMPSLETGASKQLFADWAADPRNVILFTGRPEEGTIAAQLQAHRPGQGGLVIHTTLSRRVVLEGEELAAAQDRQRQAMMEEQAAPAMARGGGADHQPLRSSSGSISKVVRTASGLADAAVSMEGIIAESAAEPVDVLIDGFAVPEGATAAMFPFEDTDDDLACDEYGQTLRLEMFNNQSTALGGDDAEEEEVEAEELPTKVVSRNVAIPVHARIVCFDFDGRSDGRSVRTILTHVAPRHLILVHGSQAATKALQDHCTAELRSVRTRVHAPRPLETVNVSPGCSSFQVVLSDQLVSSIHMRAMGDYELSWLDGVVGATEAGLVPELKAADDSVNETTQGGIFVGDVRLSELKAALAEKGIAAEFYNAMLVCQGPVTIKRQAQDGELVLEGPLCEEYYKIREVVYGQYHVC
ncbi:hypothetical protein WJX72_000827 [[Myrmecia] bisecta]|uniref:Cleavage and polyadenylation specificity factor subunit 2 n=1 Tax=[Myrmecia] bisecta TaxID=41462 RepID=A0AAW1Q2E3_9CHLO